MLQAHRVAWLLTYGSEPPRNLRCACGNQGCFRPDHQLAEEVRSTPRSLATGPSERFDFFVRRDPDCWPWMGSVTRLGYGQFSVPLPGRGRKMVSVHRFAWERAFGPIPADNDVVHRCANRTCVRPEHLLLRDPAKVLAGPTPRELEVLRAWVTHGMRYGSVRSAALDLGIEPQSASQHLVDLRRRLGVASTTAAVAHLDREMPSWRHTGRPIDINNP